MRDKKVQICIGMTDGKRNKVKQELRGGRYRTCIEQSQ